jgi:WD40 repeat protein
MNNEQLVMRNEQRAMTTNIRLLAVFFFFCGLCLNAAAQDVTVFPQMGHREGINYVKFSSDGRYVLSGSYETIIIFDTNTGREIRTFSENLLYFTCVADLSPDGNQIVKGSWDVVKILDVVTGKEIKTFSTNRLYVYSVAFSPDGKLVVSSHGDGRIKLWDVDTESEIKMFSGNTDDVLSVAFSPDGKQIISGSRNNTIQLWDISTGNEIKTFTDKNYSYLSADTVTFSPDGKKILFLSGNGSFNRTINLLDINTGNKIKTFSDGTFYESVAFSPDGKQILAGNSSGTINLWDINSEKIIMTFSINSGEWGNRVNSVAFSPDGKQVLSGSDDKTIKLWDANTGKEIRTFSGQTSRVRSIAFSHDGSQVLSGYTDTKIKLWDTNTVAEIKTFSGHAYSITSLTFSFDNKKILSGSIGSVSYPVDGREIYSNSSVKLWDKNTGNEIMTFSGHKHWINSVVFSPDAKQVLSGSSDNTIKLWDANTGREIRTFLGHNTHVLSVAFSPDGKQIISGSWGSSIKLWDVNTGIEIKDFSGHTRNVRSVTFSPDGKQILSGSEDDTIKLWDVNTGKEIKTFLGHTSGVWSVAFSPDGRQILSGSSDGTTRLWDVSTGKEIAQLISFTDGEWVVITPDGFYNASPNGDKYLNVRVSDKVYGIDQYRKTFYRPQIVEARLQGRPDPIRVTTTIQDAASFPPPVVVIRNPEKGAVLSSNQVELTVTVADQLQPIKTIKIYVNGRQIGREAMQGIIGSRGELELEATQIRLVGNQNRVEFRLPVVLDPGVNRIEVFADNPYLFDKDTVEVNYKQSATDQNILPNLWILSIGINRYNSPLLKNLDYAVNDAREIINVFKTQKGKLYNEVNSLLIADGGDVAPNRANIIDNFRFLKNAGSRDDIVLFIAGHGMNDESGNFFFMPSDADFIDGSIRPSSAIPSSIIQANLESLPGRKLVFIDSCHSEGVTGRKTRGVDSNQLIRALQDEYTLIFTASMGNELSHEIKELEHGVFTYAVIKGLKGEADFDKKGNVTIKELDAYVSLTVPKLTDKAQHPTSNTDKSGYKNFIVAELE